MFNRKALGSISLKKFDLIFFDLDNFKKLNDEHGHKFGDSVLVLFSQGLKQHTQRNEMVIRFGGDEFIAILQPCRAKTFLKDIDSTLSALKISYSYGIALNSDRRNLREAINRSDEALYRMKHQKHTSSHTASAAFIAKFDRIAKAVCIVVQLRLSANRSKYVIIPATWSRYHQPTSYYSPSIPVIKLYLYQFQTIFGLSITNSSKMTYFQ